MLKTLAQLKCIVNGKECQFLCDNDMSVEAVKEALFQFQKYVGQIEDNAKSQKEAQEAAEKSKSEENKPVDISEVSNV